MKITKICSTCLLASLLLADAYHANAQQTSRAKELNQAYVQALRLIGAQQYDNAIQSLEQIIRKDSSFSRAYTKIVTVYKYKNALDDAQVYFEGLVTEDRDNPYVHHARGLIHKEKREYQKAYESFLRSIRLNLDYHAVYPDFVEAHRDLNEAERTIRAVTEAKPNIAAAHYGLAHLYEIQQQHRKQLEAAKRAVSLRPDMLEACNLLGWAHYSLGEYADALRECERGLALSQESEDLENQISFLRLKAFIRNKLGDPTAATGLLNRALGMARDIGAKEKVGSILSGLASLHWHLSEFHEAMRYAGQALEIYRGVGDKGGQATNLNYLGILTVRLGDYSRALEYYEGARELFQEIGDMGRAGICIGNMADVYIRLGKELKAQSILADAIDILGKLGPGWKKYQATYVANMGTAFRKLGNHEKALDQYQQALQLVEKLQTEEHQVSEFLGRIGEIYQQLGDYTQAMEYYERALKINTRLFKESTKAHNLLSIAGLHLAMQNYPTAQSFYEDALKIGRKIQDVSLVWLSEAGLGAAYHKQGKRHQALDYYRQAVATLESVRSQLQLEEEKTGFITDKLEVYVRLVNLLAELYQQAPDQNYDSEAFQYAERGKARALLDIVHQARTFPSVAESPGDFRQRFVDNQKQLERRHLDLSAELAKEERERNKELIGSLEDQIEALQRARVHLLEEIKKKSPQYYRLVNPKILTAEELQRDVLGENQMLIEYLVGTERIFVWLLTKSQRRFLAIDLTPTEQAEKLAHLSPLFHKEKAAADVQIDHRWANIKTDLLHDLYQALVQKPTAGVLREGMELIIVPDDVLHYFPFEILVTAIVGDKVHYLVEKHSISYAPSASLLNPGLRKERKAPKDLLAFGNPDFGGEQRKGIIEWVTSLMPVKSVLRGSRFEPPSFCGNRGARHCRELRKSSSSHGKRGNRGKV